MSRHTFLVSVLFLAFIFIGGFNIVNAQNCEYDAPPRSITDNLIVQGQTLCGEDGPPTMLVTLSYTDGPTAFDAVVTDSNGEELFSVVDRPYANNVITVTDIEPGTEYTLRASVRNCFGETTKDFTVQAPSIESPPSSIAVEMIRCEGTDPIFYVNVEGMFGNGAVETNIDVCVGSSFEECDVASKENINSTEAASLEFPGEYDTDFYVSATAVTCQDNQLAYANFTIPTPTGPQSTNTSTIQNRSGAANRCSAYLDLRTVDIEPPSWSSSAGKWTYCYVETGTSEEQTCAEYSSSAFIEGLEFNTEYDVTVTLYDQCSDSEASVTETFTTHEKNTESLTNNGFLGSNPSITDQDFDECSGNIEFSWDGVNYADSAGPFSARFDLCVTDSESEDGSCDIFEGSLFNTRSLKTNVTLGSRIDVSVTPNNCGESSADPITREYTIEPANTPIPSSGSFSFSNGLTDYTSSTCANVLDVEWPVFLNNPTKGYSICIERDESSCTPENFERTMDASFSKELSETGTYFVSVKAENCRGESSTPLTEFYNVPSINEPTLNEAPFNSENLEPQIRVTPSCDDPRNAEIFYRGWNGYIDHYEICIDYNGDEDCFETTDESTQYTFPSTDQEYNIKVSAGNCRGRTPLESAFYLESEVVPQDDNAYILPEASVNDFCNYQFSAQLEEFVNIQSFNYCVSTDACDFNEFSTDRLISETLPSGQYDINVSGFACGNQGATLNDRINLYSITEPQFTQDLSTSVEVSSSGSSCSELFLTVSWPGVIDQEKWFTGTYELCVSTQECGTNSFNNVQGTSNTVTVVAGETYNVSVRASNCKGMTIKSTTITIPSPTKPSIEDVYIYYSVSSSSGCRRTPEFYWHDFAGRYRYCFAEKDQFESQCGAPSSWNSIGQNTYSPPSINVESSNSTHLFGLVGENCVGISDPVTVEVYLPQATLENSPIDMSQAFLNYNLIAAVDGSGKCDISVEVQGGNILQYGRPFPGVFQFCIGSSEGKCDIIELASSNQGSTTMGPLEVSGQEIFLSMWGSGCVENSNPEKITKSLIVAEPPEGEDSVNIDVSVTAGCNATRNIVASWGEIKFAKTTMEALLRDANGDEVESSGVLQASATGYTFTQTQVATDEVYSVVLSTASCGQPSDYSSGDFTVPSAVAIDNSNAAVKVESYVDSNCEVYISAEASGFENVSPFAETEYCVGRSEGRCATSVGYSSSSEYRINKYLLDQTYHATAQVSNCPSSAASSVHDTALAPIPDVISTSNAKVEVSTSQFRYCGARLFVAVSGFSVGGARYAGKYMYCVGSSQDNCDVVALLESSTTQWTIDIPVVDSREYYVTVYGYNCLGNSAKVTSSAVTFSDYGCCLSPLSATEDGASLRVTEASCTDGAPSPVLSMTNVEGTVSKLEACVGSSEGLCDIQPFRASSSSNLDKFTPSSMDPIESSNDVWISVRPSNCRSTLQPVSALVSGRPSASGERISLSVTDDCTQVKGSIPTISDASGYRFCVGTSEGSCDLLNYRNIDPSQELSISREDLGDSRTFYVQAIASNCYGDSSPIRGTVTIEDDCTGSGGVSGVAAVVPSLFLVIGALFFVLV